MRVQCEKCGGYDEKWWLVTIKQVGGAVALYSICTTCKLAVDQFIVAGFITTEATNKGENK